jgi:hypothetical protein
MPGSKSKTVECELKKLVIEGNGDGRVEILFLEQSVPVLSQESTRKIDPSLQKLWEDSV